MYDLENFKNLNMVLPVLEHMSGLQINFQKTGVFFLRKLGKMTLDQYAELCGRSSRYIIGGSQLPVGNMPRSGWRNVASRYLVKKRGACRMGYGRLLNECVHSELM
jgi:hypothetical protein